MIQIKNVSFQYSNSERGALNKINLHIAKGEFVVLLGKSGCGKTTVIRLINRLVPEFFDGKISGEVLVDGQDTSELNIQDLTGIVGSVFQDPRSQFFATDTTAEIAFSCENVGLPREELCRRMEKAVNDLQIEHLLERSIFAISSGEKQSIAIASVYALAPKILLLDEPSANLDIAATRHLMDILYTLKKQGYTIIISEHRIHYLKDIADRAILIEGGCITKEISGEEFGTLTNEEANQMGLRSTNLTKILPGHREIQQEEKQLIWNNISFAYGKAEMVLNDISFAASKGDVVGMIGSNGVGKSTLLEIACGLKKESKGSIFLHGEPFMPPKRIRNNFLVMQNSDYQLFTESVEKELYLGNCMDDGFRQKGEELLRNMELSEFIHRHPASLSGGQKQRLCIAVACMKDTDVVCFDEPTSGLDFESMRNVSNLLQNLASEGKTILVSSHDYEFLMVTCSHICHLDKGYMKDYFTLNRETAEKTYGILF